VLGVPIIGSVPLYTTGVCVYLFFAPATGIFLATVAKSMPQLGLLYILVAMPMNILSGSNTPLESMPPLLGRIMMFSPSTHFVLFAQSILFRGAYFSIVWPQSLFIGLVGGLFLALALMRFHSAAVSAS
jgi:ABC-2 type transport system permease protein